MAQNGSYQWYNYTHAARLRSFRPQNCLHVAFLEKRRCCCSWMWKESFKWCAWRKMHWQKCRYIGGLLKMHFILIAEGRSNILWILHDTKSWYLVKMYMPCYRNLTPTLKKSYSCPWIGNIMLMIFPLNWLKSMLSFSKWENKLVLKYQHPSILIFWLLLILLLSCLACNFIKKETLARVFSCEFYEISKNKFSYRTPPVTASVLSGLRMVALFNEF